VRVLVLALAVGAVGAVTACEKRTTDQDARGGIEILGGFAFVPVSTETAAYLSFSNHGSIEDTLLSISSPLADSVTLHDSRNEGGLVRMEAVERLVLPPGTSIEMEPGGLHLMLTSLKVGLTAGKRLPLVVTFARAGRLEVAVPIERYGRQP
jgi:copper(I)-binding protein